MEMIGSEYRMIESDLSRRRSGDLPKYGVVKRDLASDHGRMVITVINGL